MQTKLGAVFEEYHSIYDRIFKRIYPAKGNNGFNEENQTVNFSKAFEKICGDNSFSWFELNIKNRGRIDAVLFNIDAREIFIVESKQFWGDKELRDSFSDIERILDYGEIEILKSNFCYKDYSFFGIVLADVWLNKDRDRIVENWKEGFWTGTDDFSKLSENWEIDTINEIVGKLKNQKWYSGNFKKSLDIVEAKYSIKNKYNLLMTCWEL